MTVDPVPEPEVLESPFDMPLIATPMPAAPGRIPRHYNTSMAGLAAVADATTWSGVAAPWHRSMANVCAIFRPPASQGRGVAACKHGPPAPRPVSRFSIRFAPVGAAPPERH